MFLFSPVGIKMIESRRIRWTGHVACMWDINTYRILVGSVKGIEHSEAPGVDGRMILKWILGR
jgi:hypothetical protein